MNGDVTKGKGRRGRRGRREKREKGERETGDEGEGGWEREKGRLTLVCISI